MDNISPSSSPPPLRLPMGAFMESPPPFVLATSDNIEGKFQVRLCGGSPHSLPQFKVERCAPTTPYDMDVGLDNDEDHAIELRVLRAHRTRRLVDDQKCIETTTGTMTTNKSDTCSNTPDVLIIPNGTGIHNTFDDRGDLTIELMITHPGNSLVLVELCSGARSHPFSACERALLRQDGAPWEREFWKDQGSRKDMLSFPVRIVSGLTATIPLNTVPKLRFCLYMSDGDFCPESVLEISDEPPVESHKSSPPSTGMTSSTGDARLVKSRSAREPDTVTNDFMIIQQAAWRNLNSSGNASIKFRPQQVSSKWGGKRFVLVVDAGPNCTPVTSRPIMVLSKQRHNKRPHDASLSSSSSRVGMEHGGISVTSVGGGGDDEGELDTSPPSSFALPPAHPSSLLPAGIPTSTFSHKRIATVAAKVVATHTAPREELVHWLRYISSMLASKEKLRLELEEECKALRNVREEIEMELCDAVLNVSVTGKGTTAPPEDGRGETSPTLPESDKIANHSNGTAAADDVVDKRGIGPPSAIPSRLHQLSDFLSKLDSTKMPS